MRRIQKDVLAMEGLDTVLQPIETGEGTQPSRQLTRRENLPTTINIANVVRPGRMRVRREYNSESVDNIRDITPDSGHLFHHLKGTPNPPTTTSSSDTSFLLLFLGFLTTTPSLSYKSTLADSSFRYRATSISHSVLASSLSSSYY